MTDSFKIVVQCFQITVPIFADSIEVFSSLTSYRIEELFYKLVFHMLNSIQSHSIKVKFCRNPFSPTIQLGNDFRMIQVNVIT